MLETIIRQSEFLYVSICMDVFSSAYAPGVSARQPLGLLPWHVLPLLNRLAESGKVLILDIAEVNPLQDKDNLTAQLGASLVSHYIHHYLSL
jgi:formiminoglutamase